MKEKLAKKLTKLLAKAGLEEDKVAEILGEVEEAITEEDVEDTENTNPEENDGQPGPAKEEGKEEGNDGNKTDEDKPEDKPVEELPPAPQPEENPTDGSIEQVLAQAAAEEGRRANDVREPEQGRGVFVCGADEKAAARPRRNASGGVGRDGRQAFAPPHVAHARRLVAAVPRLGPGGFPQAPHPAEAGGHGTVRHAPDDRTRAYGRPRKRGRRRFGRVHAPSEPEPGGFA